MNFWSFWNFITQPFVLGLLLGLLVTLFVLINGHTLRRHLSKELKRLEGEKNDLQNHLQTHLKIHAGGSEKIVKELDDLRTKNETLRVNLSVLKQKPGQAELDKLRITEAAVRLMNEQAPGFAPVWEKALRQAEADAEAEENGRKKIPRVLSIRRVLSMIGHGPTQPEAPLVIEDKTDAP